MISVGIIDHNKADIQRTTEILQTYSNDDAAPQEKQIKILFEAETFQHVTELSVEETPDILLLEIKGQEERIIKKVLQAWPRTQIVILSEFDDLQHVRRSFRSGAVSYLHKEYAGRFLAPSIEITYEGGSFVSPFIGRALATEGLSAQQKLDGLTAREHQVAEGLLEGLSYKMIADKHKISLDTVRAYIKRIYRKLSVNSKGEFVALLKS